MLINITQLVNQATVCCSFQSVDRILCGVGSHIRNFNVLCQSPDKIPSVIYIASGGFCSFTYQRLLIADGTKEKKKDTLVDLQIKKGKTDAILSYKPFQVLCAIIIKMREYQKRRDESSVVVHEILCVCGLFA